MLKQLLALFAAKQETISTQELQALVKTKQIQLLDVRSKTEYQAGHIKQARHFPLNQIETYKGPKGNPLYLICQSGMRSQKASRILTKLGYQTINVKGGMAAWTGPVSQAKF
ncbi:rhodanese-like domain-containing protein [Streptococcus ictaluri]|uniref:Rhodanese-like protein n=1 Tax=Streptococcus ictaluri 707-05 TaxID=764299 RepID=G5K004_9STRE|nr:rhodanese-like domain-containing protein [Streptococcus ictaluri]EHI70964.1 rhodanese-like protein [Streptococcus ictaluri 707-05]